MGAPYKPPTKGKKDTSNQGGVTLRQGKSSSKDKNDESKQKLDLSEKVYEKQKMEAVPKLHYYSKFDRGAEDEEEGEHYGPKRKEGYGKFYEQVKKKLLKKIDPQIDQRIVEPVNVEQE